MFFHISWLSNDIYDHINYDNWRELYPLHAGWVLQYQYHDDLKSY